MRRVAEPSFLNSPELQSTAVAIAVDGCNDPPSQRNVATAAATDSQQEPRKGWEIQDMLTEKQLEAGKNLITECSNELLSRELERNLIVSGSHEIVEWRVGVVRGLVTLVAIVRQQQEKRNIVRSKPNAISVCYSRCEVAFGGRGSLSATWGSCAYVEDYDTESDAIADLAKGTELL